MTNREILQTKKTVVNMSPLKKLHSRTWNWLGPSPETRERTDSKQERQISGGSPKLPVREGDPQNDHLGKGIPKLTS